MLPYNHLNNKAYTLTEVLITIVVLGVLISLALPNYSTVIERGRTAEAVSILGVLHEAQKLYQFENGTWSNDPDLLEVTYENNAIKYYDETTLTGRDGATECTAAKLCVASIEDSNNRYRLLIDEDGVITCEWVSGPVLCAKFGY